MIPRLQPQQPLQDFNDLFKEVTPVLFLGKAINSISNTVRSVPPSPQKTRTTQLNHTLPESLKSRGLSELPDDCLIGILINLPTSQLLMYRSVCSKWRELIDTHPDLQDKPFIKKYEKKIKPWLSRFSTESIKTLDQVKSAAYFPLRLDYETEKAMNERKKINFKEIHLTKNNKKITHARFSPDSNSLMICDSKNIARLWQENKIRTTWQEQCKVKHSNVIHSTAFSRDSNMAVCTSADKTASLFMRKKGRWHHNHTLTGWHDGIIYKAKYSPDCTYLALASEDTTATIHTKLKDGWKHQLTIPHNDIQNPPHDDHEVIGVEFSPNSQMMATACRDGRAKVASKTGHQWSITGIIDHPSNHPDIVRSIKFHPTQPCLLSMAGQCAKVSIFKNGQWATGFLIDHKEKTDFSYSKAIFSSTGEYIITATAARDRPTSVQISGPLTEAEQKQNTLNRALLVKNTEPEPVAKVLFSKDEKNMLICSGNTAQIWEKSKPKNIFARLLLGDQERWKKEKTIQHRNLVISAAERPLSSLRMTASYDGTFKCLGTYKGKHIEKGRILMNYTYQGCQAAFNRDGRFVITKALEGSKIWQIL